MTSLERRYARALASIGGEEGYKNLPNSVKNQLNRYRTLRSKTQALELVAQNFETMKTYQNNH